MSGNSEQEIEGFCLRLRQCIGYLGMNQSEFSRRISVSPGFMSEVLRGNKLPGTTVLFAIKKTFGVSVDWLLSGDGTPFGRSTIDMDLLRTIRLYVELARSAINEQDPAAKALLSLIGEGRLSEASASPGLSDFLDRLCPENEFDVSMELYNGNLSGIGEVNLHRNLLAAAVAHYESRRPCDRLAVLSRASTVKKT